MPPQVEQATPSMNQWLLESLDTVLSLGASRQGAVDGNPVPDILARTTAAIRRAVAFEAFAFLEADPGSLDFPVLACDPPTAADGLRREVEHAISEGVFGWALHRNHAVQIPARFAQGDLLLHSLTTRSRVVGMFVGQLGDRHAFVPDAAQKVLSILVMQCASMLEGARLWQEVEAHHRISRPPSPSGRASWRPPRLPRSPPAGPRASSSRI
jgi:hypothetical protein